MASLLRVENLAVSYLRSAPADRSDHPFNGPGFQELLAEEAPGCLVLCSLHPAAYFYRLGPYIENFLDMGLS